MADRGAEFRARWPDRQTREQAGRETVDAELRRRMHDAIEETLLVLPAVYRWFAEPRRDVDV